MLLNAHDLFKQDDSVGFCSLVSARCYFGDCLFFLSSAPGVVLFELVYFWVLIPIIVGPG